MPISAWSVSSRRSWSLKPSFTSTRNPEPESVQVILRTEAITKPDTPAEEVDESGDNRTFLQRLGDVFQTIWDSITGLFD